MDYIEILRELKLAYEYLQDVKENTDYIDRKSMTTIGMFAEITEAYYEAYKDAEEHKVNLSIRNPYDNQIYRIYPYIQCDYYDTAGNELTCGDIGYYWYKEEQPTFIDKEQDNNEPDICD